MAETSSETGPVTSERWELRIGATVHATDDKVGRLRQVVVFPGQQQVVGLVVRGMVPLQEYVAPIEAVQEADEWDIRLSWTAAEVHARGSKASHGLHTTEWSLRGYAAGEVAIPLRGAFASEAPERLASANVQPIRAGLQVAALDGGAGRVNRVMVDAASGSVTDLVIHRGLISDPDILVPAAWVASVTATVITLGVMRADLAALPVYIPDEELEDLIKEAWWDDPEIDAILHVTDLRPAVRDGIAALRGYVRSSALRRRMEALARQVRGVLDVRNELVADDELEDAVQLALSEDPRTRGHAIEVHSDLGSVELHGTLEDEETRLAAEEVAASVRHVKTVINRLEASVRPPVGSPHAPPGDGATAL